MTERVVAVPRSMIICGTEYSLMPAAAATTRSLPSWAGLSIRMLRPVLIPGPTIIGVTPESFSTAAFMVAVTVGTTEEIIAPVMSDLSIPWRLKAVSMTEAYSKAVDL